MFMDSKITKPTVAILDKEWKEPTYKSGLFRFLSRFAPGLIGTIVHWYWYLTEREYRLAIDLDRFFRIHTDRIDLLPESSGERGFVLSIDQTLALFFVQDGDGFFYEGWSLSDPGVPYEKGSPLVSDTLRDFYDAKETEDRTT
jgi:hypothetical protein